MKTNFHGNVRKKSLGRRIVVVVILIVIGLNFFDILWPQTVVRSVLGPIVTVRTFLLKPFSGVTASFANKTKLAEENRTLKNRVTELELATLQATVDVSTSLAVIAEREHSPEGEQVPVLMRPPFSPYDSLIIDTRKVSASPGDKVFAFGVLIGEITTVDEKTASVNLYTSPNTKTAVRIADIDTEATGQGGGRYVMTIPKDIKVEIGTAIVVPSAFNVLLGAVGAVEVDKNGTFQNVHATIPVSLNQLTVVTLTKPADVLE